MAKIQGLNRLRRKLKAMPDRIEAQIKAALEKSADEIVVMAKNLVPVDQGDLRDSISWTWGDPPGGASILATSSRAGEYGDLRITIYCGGGDAFHARFVEFGTQHMRAIPFFYPSYRANKKRARGRITRAINKAVKEVASS